MAWLLGVDVKITTDSSVIENTPYIYIANHQNSYDVVTVCKAAKRGVITIGKKSLIWIPIFGLIYFLSGNIMINRTHRGSAQNSLAKAARQIKDKALSVWVFPEGTRSYGRGLLPFKTGAFRLALETEVPIAMVCVSNTHNKIRLNRWNNGTVSIKICAPQPIDDTKTAREWANSFHQKMKDEISQLDNEHQ